MVGAGDHDPLEYAEFRGSLGTVSGFQSCQYRAVEFVLGNKTAQFFEVFAHGQAAQDLLSGLLHRPSIDDSFLHLLHRRGHQIPASVLERDVTRPYEFEPDLVPAFQRIYQHPNEYWEEYEACEELVDLEENFQLWRFRHVRTVQRSIGFKQGSGGSSGVDFLRKALDLTFFPELYAVRTEIGAPATPARATTSGQ